VPQTLNDLLGVIRREVVADHDLVVVEVLLNGGTKGVPE
jgi:hypothetical protein